MESDEVRLMESSLLLLKSKNRKAASAKVPDGNAMTWKDSRIEKDEEKAKMKKVIAWRCKTCNHECIPVREQSRCLCSHRLRDHPSEDSFRCKNTTCKCSKFFYIVAEGAWILRCRCKHKHTDHDPSGKVHECRKPNCSCSGFDSPWVCNCDHPWKDHEQLEELRKVKSLAEMFMDNSIDFGVGGHVSRGGGP